MIKQIIICITFLYIGNAIAQNNVYNKLIAWWNFNGSYEISEQWSIHGLYSWRRANFVENWQQSLLRIGIEYKITNNFSITPGYDWVITFPYGKQPVSEKFTEHRLFEQGTLQQKIGRLQVKHRYRFEQRFFNRLQLVKHRFRYRLGLSVPVSNNKKWSVETFDELFVNYGSNANNHIFDQNWLYGGIRHQFKEYISVKLGYIDQYILKSEHNPIVQLGVNVALKR